MGKLTWFQCEAAANVKLAVSPDAFEYNSLVNTKLGIFTCFLHGVRGVKTGHLR